MEQIGLCKLEQGRRTGPLPAQRIDARGQARVDARAVFALAEGNAYMSPGISSMVIERMKAGPGEDQGQEPYDRLTLREREVLQLIAEGKSNKEIASLFNISVNTVAVHRARIMETLGIHRTAELVLYAVKKGLVKPQ